jgi:hypothetical protein
MNSNETGMIMQDRRQTAEPAALSPALVEQATQQLQREIHLIEGWLNWKAPARTTRKRWQPARPTVT